jgi:hypothetical protein
VRTTSGPCKKAQRRRFGVLFFFVPIENGFREAVVVALTPKKQTPRLQTITPRQQEAKKMDLQQGTTTPLHPCGPCKKAQRQKKVMARVFFFFYR